MTEAWDDLILAGFILLPLLLARALYYFFVQRRAHQRGKAVWIVVGNGLVFFFLCSLALLGGEIYYRFFYDTTQVTDVTKTSKSWFKRHWKENSWGLRDDEEYSHRRVPGQRRVSFIGDSFTAGHGVEVEERFANLYRARRPDLEVHVLAGRGADTGHELNLLGELLGRGYQFDLVVLCYFLNDTADLLPEMNEVFRKHRLNPTSLLQHSYFLNTLYWRLTLLNDPYVKDYYNVLIRSYQGTTWETQQKRLVVMRDLIRDNGGRLAVVTWPFLNFGPEGYKARPVHEQLDAFWKELGVPHLDLLPFLEPYPARELIVNPYDSHPNPRAHAIAADAITVFLDQLLAQSKGS